MTFISITRRLLEMIRFSHTIFALPFAFLSAGLAWMQNAAEGRPFRWLDVVGILLCMVFARSVAMAFNRLIDRRLDAVNPRTASRHLPAGTLSVTTVVAFLLACTVGFLASTLLFLPNTLPLLLSAPVLLFLCGYSYTKRFTALCHYWLGVALMLAPVAAWIAVRGEFAATPCVLGSAVCFWVGGFDIIYACQDAATDRQQKLYSIPSRLGVPLALRLAAASHFITVLLLTALLFVAQLGWIYASGVVAVACLLVYEHLIVKPDDLTRVNIAFFHTNAIISVALLVVTLLDAWLIH